MLKSYFILKSEEVFGLPNIKSAKKRVLVSQTKAMQNKAAKSALKTEIKKFEAAVAEGNRSEADVAYKVARSRRWTRLPRRACCTRTMPPTRRAA